MQTVARLRYARIAAQKARLVADLVRGLPVSIASEKLTFSTKKAALLIKKVLDSAIANAENNFGADIDELHIFRIFVDEGSVYKRTSSRAKGRATRILKRTCHITVIVSENRQERV